MEKIKKVLAEKRNIFMEIPLLAKIIFLLAFIFICYLAFFQLGNSPLQNQDEAWYGDTVRSMLQSHEYIVLYWNHVPWLGQQPLYIWLANISTSILGNSEFSLRAPSVICGIVLAMLVMGFTYKNYGLVSSLIAFVTLTLNTSIISRMRSVNTDTLSALLLFLFFLVQVGQYKYKYLLLGLLFGAILLTSASLFIYPFIIFVITESLYHRKLIVDQYKSYLLVFCLPLVMVGLWLLIGTLKVGPSFYQSFLFSFNHGSISLNVTTLLDYFTIAYNALHGVFFFVFIVGFIFAIRYIKNHKMLLIILYSFSFLMQLSVAEKINNVYFIPSVIFWSILCAFAVYNVLNLLKNNIVVSGIIILLTLFFGYRIYTTDIIPVFKTTGPIAQKVSGSFLHSLTKEGDEIVRLDNLYPVTIYYSERRVLSSPKTDTHTDKEFISRKDLLHEVNSKKLHWLIGSADDIHAFKLTLPETILSKEIKITPQETMLQMIQF